MVYYIFSRKVKTQLKHTRFVQCVEKVLWLIECVESQMCTKFCAGDFSLDDAPWLGRQLKLIAIKVWKFLSHVQTLCNPMDSIFHGILQARILEWVAIPFSLEPRSPSLQADSLPAESQGKSKNTGVGSHSLLQDIFLTQGLNPGLPHCRQILYQLNHKGSPRILEWVAVPFSRESFWPRNRAGISCIAGGFFTNWAIREAWIEIIKTLIESSQCYTMWEIAKILKISKSINRNPLHQLGCFLLCVVSTQVKQRKTKQNLLDRIPHGNSLLHCNKNVLLF